MLMLHFRMYTRISTYALWFLLALLASSVGFAQSYTGCNGNPATGKLQLWVVSSNPSTGSVTVNGVDVRQPTITPFTWVWGDGSTTQGWFPQSHVYASLSNTLYTLQVTSHEDDGSTDCAQLLIGPASSYSDNFEAPSINSFWAIQQQLGVVSLSTNQNHTLGGTQSVQFSSMSGGQRQIGLKHQFAIPQTGDFSIYFYDVAPGVQTQYEQISLYNSQTADLASIGTQDFDAFCYEAQLYNYNTGVRRGPNANCGQYPQTSTTNVPRTSGWHKFDIQVTSTAITLSIDGATVFTTAANLSYDLIQIVQSGPGFRPDTVSYWDDFAYQPSPTACTYVFTPNSQSFGATGGVSSFQVATGTTCPSFPTTTDPWITIVSPAVCPILNGCVGPRTVIYSAATNTGGARNGAISVGGQQFAVSQAGTSCGSTIQPNSASPDDTGGSFAVSVSVAGGCHWTAVSHVPWITVKSGSSGVGGGVVVLNVAANTGGQRSGTVTIAGQTFTVNQGGGACGAVDITSKVNKYRNGVTWVGPFSWEYAQTIGVTNTSGALIPGPVYFVMVGMPSSEQLPYTTYLSPSPGVTTCFSANGDYLVPITYGSMSPGQAITETLSWFITGTAPVNYYPKILSGTPSH